MNFRPYFPRPSPVLAAIRRKISAPNPVNNILYTVSTQQHQYSNIMYAIGYNVATCFDRKQANIEHFFKVQKGITQWDPISFICN